MKIKDFFRKVMEYTVVHAVNTGMFDKMDDELYLNLLFQYSLGYKPNFDDPKTINEKYNWMKLYDRKPIYTTLVDKYEVKRFIAEHMGEEYVIPLLGVWDSPDEIDFDSLPEQFVLKSTHNSGTGLCICKDKSKLDIPAVKAELKKALNINYYYPNREYPYKNVKPRIIAEKFISANGTDQLDDYKFFLFNGKVNFIQYNYDWVGVNHKANFYTTDWELMNLSFKNYDRDLSRIIPKPEKLNELIAFVEKLYKYIENPPIVRIDMYVVGSKIYFGEITFFNEAGFGQFVPKDYDRIFGDMIKLPPKTE